MIKLNDVLLLTDHGEPTLVLVTDVGRFFNDELGLEVLTEESNGSDKMLLSKQWFLDNDHYRAINLGQL
jgi:hypothetical protein